MRLVLSSNNYNKFKFKAGDIIQDKKPLDIYDPFWRVLVDDNKYSKASYKLQNLLEPELVTSHCSEEYIYRYYKRVKKARATWIFSVSGTINGFKSIAKLQLAPKAGLIEKFRNRD